jgi:hypothetical protein
MKSTKILTLLSSILLIANFSHAVSDGNTGPNNPWTELTNCIHQASVLGKRGQVIYQKAYKYDVVEEGQPCPPFKAEYEVPWNEIPTENIAWGGVAIPLEEDVGEVYECESGQEVCDEDGCMIMLDCDLFITSPTDHSCRFGQGGGNPI